MSQPPWGPPGQPEPERILSAGLPPGYDPDQQQQASAPSAVTYMRAYGGIVGVLYLALGALFVGLMVKEALSKPGGGSVGGLVGAALLGTLLGSLAALHLAVLVGGRRPWVHTVATIAVALDLTSACCWLPGIPLLILWLRPDVRAFYADPPR